MKPHARQVLEYVLESLEPASADRLSRVLHLRYARLETWSEIP